MTVETSIECPITILKKLHQSVLVDDWVNEEAKKHFASGIKISIDKLKKHGFIELSKEELAITPLPRINPQQLEFYLPTNRV